MRLLRVENNPAGKFEARVPASRAHGHRSVSRNLDLVENGDIILMGTCLMGSDKLRLVRVNVVQPFTCEAGERLHSEAPRGQLGALQLVQRHRCEWVLSFALPTSFPNTIRQASNLADFVFTRRSISASPRRGCQQSTGSALGFGGKTIPTYRNGILETKRR